LIYIERQNFTKKKILKVGELYKLEVCGAPKTKATREAHFGDMPFKRNPHLGDYPNRFHIMKCHTTMRKHQHGACTNVVQWLVSAYLPMHQCGALMSAYLPMHHDGAVQHG
jgi:hypothetical protein